MYDITTVSREVDAFSWTDAISRTSNMHDATFDRRSRASIKGIVRGRGRDAATKPFCSSRRFVREGFSRRGYQYFAYFAGSTFKCNAVM